MVLAGLDETIERIRGVLDTKYAAREQALVSSRQLIRYCATSIRASHRQDHDEAAELLASAAEIAQQLGADLVAHPDLFYAGYTQDALKEYTEASITSALILGRELPTPESLNVPVPAYLNGMGEAMGEMRRYVLDLLRRGDAMVKCEYILACMDEVYGVLVTLDYPDSLTSGLRRTTDMVRGVLERTRGDVTTAAGLLALQRYLEGIDLSQVSEGQTPDSVVNGDGTIDG